MALRLGPRFDKALARLAPDDRRRTLQALKRFVENPAYPGLNFEKLGGHRDKYTIRATLALRIFLISDGADFIASTVDNHEKYDKL